MKIDHATLSEMVTKLGNLGAVVSGKSTFHGIRDLRFETNQVIEFVPIHDKMYDSVGGPERCGIERILMDGEEFSDRTRDCL